ncbi:hypothetical protein HNV12_00685 [Methanococcoides sp. SA1]|nr:hypothetical protein [Methanococcoides sp. SA1]
MKKSDIENTSFVNSREVEINKRGQFFLLAAVIISVVVLSLGVTTNQAVFSEEPENFYDFSYEVTRESGAIIDYEVYAGFDDGANLDQFIELLSEDIKERSPDSDFMFIYGDEDEIKLKNYGRKDVSVGDDVVIGSNEGSNKVCFKNFCNDISTSTSDFDGASYVFEKGDILGDEIIVDLSGNEFRFPISKNKQVLFIMEKDIGDEKFIAAG